LVDHVVDCALHGRRPVQGIAQAGQVMETAFGAIESAASGRTVSLMG
jgi:hypothetical protein